MKIISDIFGLGAVLMLMFIIYGPIGAYEAETISGLQFLKCLFLSGIAEAALIAGKRITASVTANNSRRIKRASNNKKEAS